MMRKLSLCLCLVAFSLLAGCDEKRDNHLILKRSDSEIKSDLGIKHPKNIILLIGDGMGYAHVKAYRKFKDEQETRLEEKTAFDDYLVGSLNTESVHSHENITDSAAAATALASGYKTYNQYVSINSDGQPVKTILERAKQLGKSTGLIATSEIVHATPAAFASHHVDREDKDLIADQYFDNKINGLPAIDLMLGGGAVHFEREDRDLVKLFRASGYQVINSRQALGSVDQTPVLGLFNQYHIPRHWDKESDTPSLKDMTEKAIELLSKNEKGFFLLVEASLIDWAAHDHDIVGVISEMEGFEQAFKAAIDFAIKDGETLVVATSDHEAGGLSIGSSTSGEDNYIWDPRPIKLFDATLEKITVKAMQHGDLVKTFQKYSHMKLSSNDMNYLQNIPLDDYEVAARAIGKMVAEKTYTGWTTHGHTGVDVPIYAFGNKSELFRGYSDNTRVAKVIFQLLELDHQQ